MGVGWLFVWGEGEGRTALECSWGKLHLGAQIWGERDTNDKLEAPI